MKVKNIMFSGFAAAILMGVGAANAAVIANPVTLADQGYVDAKVGQVDAKLADYATTAQLGNYQQKLSGANAGDNIAISEEGGVVKIGASNVVKTGDVWTAADGVNAGANNADTDAYLNAAAAIDDKVPSVAAARQIAGVVLKSVDEVSGNLDTVQQQIGSYDSETGAGSGLLKDVADNKKAIEANKDSIDLLNAADTVEGSVAHSIAAALQNDNGSAKYETAGAAAAAEAAAKAYADGLASNYDAEGAAAQALVDAKAYTDAEIDKVEVNVTANTTAIEKLNGDGDGSVKKLAADAATAAVNASGHATQDALQAEIDRATAAEGANAGAIDALEKGKLDVVESAGTYMVTRDAEGNVSYTKVRVATVDGEGNATVTD